MPARKGSRKNTKGSSTSVATTTTSHPVSRSTVLLSPKSSNSNLRRDSSSTVANPPARTTSRVIPSQSTQNNNVNSRAIFGINGSRTSLHSGILRSPHMLSPRNSIIVADRNGLLRSPTPTGLRLPPVSVHHQATAANSHNNANGSRRSVFSPVLNQRSNNNNNTATVSVEVPHIPITPLLRHNSSSSNHHLHSQNDPSDIMRIQVSKTPFTTKRTIESYKSDKDPIKTFVRLKPRLDDLGEVITDDDNEDSRSSNSDSDDFDKVVDHTNKQRRHLKVVNDKEVEINQATITVGSGKDRNQLRGERYLFTGVLKEQANQREAFRRCAVPVIHDLFHGYNTLLFSYGVTNSGKTYSIQGDYMDPGLLPRTIQAIFKYVDTKGGQGDFSIHPKYATQVEWCSDSRVINPTFRMSANEQVWINSLSEEADSDLAEVLAESNSHDPPVIDGDNEEFVYQLYASYFEVYNEMIHDLLDYSTLILPPSTTTTPDNNNGDSDINNGGAKRSATISSGGGRGRGRGRTRGKGRNRTTMMQQGGQNPQLMNPSAIVALETRSLNLRSEGGRGTETFVDGVTEVRIRTLQDAIRVLMHGQMRRSVHATGMNNTSSRSHALFMVKVVKIRRDAAIEPNMPIPKDACVSVRTLTLVDLAGSERAKRTQNKGDRLAEASKINTSLMTLKKCLDIKRYNTQLLSDNPDSNQLFSSQPSTDGLQIVPYNESKLTRLFQPALEGGARTVMLVCIDPWDSLENPLAETKNILDFARVASSIVLKVRKQSSPPPPMMPSLSSRTLSTATQNEDRVYQGDREDEEDEDDDNEIPTFSKRSRPSHMPGAGLDAGKEKKKRLTLKGTWDYATNPSAEPLPVILDESSAGLADSEGPESAKSPSHPYSQPAPAINGDFKFRAKASPNTPIKLRQSVFSAQQKVLEEKETEIESLRSQLKEHRNLVSKMERERETELQSLTGYINGPKNSFRRSQEKYVDEQMHSVNIETKTRKQLTKFYMAKIAELKAQADSRLHEEQMWSETKSAHKIDLLVRLKSSSSSHPYPSSSTSTLVLGPNGMTSESTKISNTDGEDDGDSSDLENNLMLAANGSDDHDDSKRVIAQLRADITTLQVQLHSVQDQSEASEKVRKQIVFALEATQDRLERSQSEVQALREEKLEVATTEMKARDKHWSAQVKSLEESLLKMEKESRESRRQWEICEMMPLREELEKLRKDPENSKQKIEQLSRDRDQAWLLLEKQENECSNLRQQNSLLLREIAIIRGQLDRVQQDSDNDQAGGGNNNLRGRKLTRKRLAGGLGITTITNGKESATLSGNISDGQNYYSSDHGQRERRQGRAHRVVSRVLSHFSPDSKRHYNIGTTAAADSSRPKTIIHHSHNNQTPITDSDKWKAEMVVLDEGDENTRSPRVRSVVYSGDVIASPTGGHSVTFTHEEVKDIPLSPTVSAALQHSHGRDSPVPVSASPRHNQFAAVVTTLSPRLQVEGYCANGASPGTKATPARGLSQRNNNNNGTPNGGLTPAFATPDEALEAYSKGQLSPEALQLDTPASGKQQPKTRRVGSRKAADEAKSRMEKQSQSTSRPTRAAARAASNAMSKVIRGKKNAQRNEEANDDQR